MSDHIVVDRARREDLPAVVDLCMMVEAQHEAYWPLRWKTKPNIREGYLRWMGNNLESRRMIIIAARDPAAAVEPEIPHTRFHDQQPGLFEGIAPNPTRVVGMLLAAVEDEIPIYTYRQFAFIHDMAVAAAYRKAGVARRMIQVAADWARELGLNQLRLMVADENTEGRIAFERAGFRLTYHEMVLPLE